MAARRRQTAAARARARGATTRVGNRNTVRQTAAARGNARRTKASRSGAIRQSAARRRAAAARSY